MENTKEMRLAVYKEAINIFTNSIVNGLCSSIFKSCHLIYDYMPNNIDPFLHLEEWPEIQKRKPLSTYSIAYWFKPFVVEPRIKILEEAIKEIEDSL